MSQPYSVGARWENRQGVHTAELRFQPEIATRPGCVGISLSEKIETSAGCILSASEKSHQACIVVDRDLALQWHRHFALVLEDPMVPASALREALALVDMATGNALADNASVWATIGEERERLGEYLPVAEPEPAADTEARFEP